LWHRRPAESRKAHCQFDAFDVAVNNVGYGPFGSPRVGSTARVPRAPQRAGRGQQFWRFMVL
jgi:hypothetical protein